MRKGHDVKGFVEGHLRQFRIDSPVAKGTVERLLQLTGVPTGGVYVIHHPPTNVEGRDFFKEFVDRNPGMRAYVGYTAFETDSIPEPWVESCNCMDEIWVPSLFNMETFSAAGVARDKLHVIPHGFDPTDYRPESTPPLEVGNRKGFNFLSIFEWTHRKGWDVLIRAYLEEFDPQEDVRLIVRSYQGGGVVGPDVPPVVEQLSRFIAGLGYDPEHVPDIHFLDTMVSSESMPSLYKAADAFVMPTRGEGWGIPFTESMLMEVPVIATRWGGHLQFMNHNNSYLISIDGIVPVSEEQVRDNPLYQGHKWAEPSLEDTRRLLRHVFENREEAKEKGRAAREHILNHFTIHDAAVIMGERLQELKKKKASVSSENRVHLESAKKKGHPRPPELRILYQARPSIFSFKGGDTDLMVGLMRRFEDNGVRIDFSSNTYADLSEYDLVHIFNFDTSLAVNAALQEKPCLVTPLYENTGRFYAKSMETVSLFGNFLEEGDLDALEKQLAGMRQEDPGASIPRDYIFAAAHAQAILVNGDAERSSIRRDFPNAAPIDLVRLGFDRPFEGDSCSGELFASEYGVKDFVLCVGRLESRKNQLMLIHALRDVDVPLVFINSDTIQPYYEELCRRYERKAETIFTGRVSKEMLFSAYRAARVHALPSWYELPGLVSLEAAWLGSNIVCPDWGTVRDYLGGHAFYCEPDEPGTMKSAVISALQGRYPSELQERLGGFTWETMIQKVYRIYEKVRAKSSTAKGLRRLRASAESARKEMIFHQLTGRAYGETRTRPAEAIESATQLMQYRDNNYTLHFIRGMGYLSLSKYEEAEAELNEAIRIQPCFGMRVYLYLSVAMLKQGKHAEALQVLHRGLNVHPFASDEMKALGYEYLAQAYRGIGEATAAETAAGRHRTLRDNALGSEKGERNVAA